ncbi:hypothetical protein EVAR_33175_1 [Eumeta japonica]|uniref:Uncharacterized protein n=1 Tax=Eumeta variegata TaxID=151549 RepID=A0A4C1W2I5_EUMVA|nr:hypothetical protein EVAR_33175_1 [Eumeta japonica]
MCCCLKALSYKTPACIIEIKSGNRIGFDSKRLTTRSAAGLESGEYQRQRSSFYVHEHAAASGQFLKRGQFERNIQAAVDVIEPEAIFMKMFSGPYFYMNVLMSFHARFCSILLTQTPPLSKLKPRYAVLLIEDNPARQVLAQTIPFSPKNSFSKAPIARICLDAVRSLSGVMHVTIAACRALFVDACPYADNCFRDRHTWCRANCRLCLDASYNAYAGSCCAVNSVQGSGEG